MAAAAGRALTISWDGSALLGVREKGVSANGEPIDVTSNEDSGDRTLLAIAGQRNVDIAISGVAKDDVLQDEWFAGTISGAVVVTYPSGATLSGTGILANLNTGAPYNDAVTFDATIQFSGTLTYTPAV